MSGAFADLRRAVRTARRRPGFSALVVVTIAVAIGLNSAVFSLFDALLLRPPAVADRDRLVRVYSSTPADFLSHGPLAFPDFEAIRDETVSLSGVAAYAWYPLALDRETGSELVIAEVVTGAYFATLGVAPVRGRVLVAADDRPSAALPVAVLSHEAWRRRFAGHPDVVGRQLVLNGRRFTVVGVAPPSFRGLVPGFAPDLWLPLHAAVTLPTGVTIALGESTPGVPRTADRTQRWVWVIGRLRGAAGLDDAAAELAVLSRRHAKQLPAHHTRRSLVPVAFDDVRLLPGVDRAVGGGAVVVVAVFALGLVLAALDLASLFVARAFGRRREIATRLALGAGRAQLVRQLLFEGLVLSLAGALLGLVIAHGSNRLLARVELPLASSVNWPLDLVLAPSLDWRVLAFAAGAAGLVAVLCGLLPALEATRADLAAQLRQLAGGTTAPAIWGLRSLAVAAQVAVAIVLVAAASVGVRSLLRATQVAPGFVADRAVAITLSPDLVGYSTQDAAALFDRVRERIEALAGVESAAFASHLPLTAAINFGEAAAADGDAPEIPVDFASVGPGYFDTMGIPLVDGRGIDATDGASAPRAVVVNEALARLLWPGRPAVGRRLRDRSLVVGVARDGRYRTLAESQRSFLYRSLGQDPRGTCTLVVRVAGDARERMPAFHAAVRAVDPRVPVSPARPLAAAVDGALALPRAAAGLLGAFGGLALMLAAAGVFGIVAFVAGSRQREVGLRLALGASRGAILRWLLRCGLRPVIAGLVAGAGLAAAASWAASARLPAVRPLDGPALAAAVAALTVAAVGAALVPAWLAARRDPGAALRHE